ncbi:hypothetical protein MUCCIDRAFT_111291 [Mucor lusitanicus CBS 277.49]|uniref:Uncharacterized protein n=1 Tax=Mucor lusitanicus CBS 277.49 TaxID=747725 RepID=A0A168K394_MUCCL|nr:hypothetical protein MUCCIDRAFT_111291 [Mucor lusitanicus CBS 277.49]
MTGSQVKILLDCLHLKTLKEICKQPTSANSHMHFSTEEGASAFYNTYAQYGLTIANMRFTIHPPQMSNGSQVSYRHRELRFTPVATPSAPGTTTTTANAHSDNSAAVEAAHAHSYMYKSQCMFKIQLGADLKCM